MQPGAQVVNYIYMGVSENRVFSPQIIGFSIINHPFWGIPIFGNTHIYLKDIFPMGDDCNISDLRCVEMSNRAENTVGYTKVS